jgi:nucleotide-binding universal stress UspA family protein
MVNLKKILLPIDFSARSAGVVAYAKAFASSFQSQLVLLSVEDPHRALRAGHMHQIRTQLESFGQDEFPGLPLSFEVTEGDPAAKIVQFAQAEQVDLIMMPTRGYGPYRRFLLGSVAAKVLHDCDLPVWTSAHVEASPSSESISYHKIACAVDLGPHTEPVVSWAAGLASTFGAQLEVIHVTKPVVPLIAEASAPDPEAALVGSATDEIEKLLRKLNVKAEIAVESGPVLEVTYNRTARFAADLLIIGRHAAKGIGGRLHAHAYEIIRESPCPVISV